MTYRIWNAEAGRKRKGSEGEPEAESRLQMIMKHRYYHPYYWHVRFVQETFRRRDRLTADQLMKHLDAFREKYRRYNIAGMEILDTLQKHRVLIPSGQHWYADRINLGLMVRDLEE